MPKRRYRSILESSTLSWDTASQAHWTEKGLETLPQFGHRSFEPAQDKRGTQLFLMSIGWSGNCVIESYPAHVGEYNSLKQAVEDAETER